MITPYSNIISVTTLEVLLLDTYSGAAAAYSLRRLSGAYTGSAIRVRRASDNTELDIGFVANQLDTSALTTFCSGTNGFVKTWYDQSGNGYDATQTTAANQPQIVSSGSVISENGKPSVQFDNTNDFMNTSPFSSLSNASYFIVSQLNIGTGNSDYSYIFSTEGASAPIQSLAKWQNVSSDANKRYVYDGSALSFDGINSLNQELASLFFPTSSPYLNLYINNLSQTFNSTPSSALSPLNKYISIGRFDAAGVNFVDGKLQEFIVYASDQSSNRTGIETNINAQYQLYWDGSQTSLLDSYGGSAAAYSLRALSSAYVGPLVRVRRASDNAEQDICANYDGTLNTSSLESFCSGTDGFVKTWYDQSGNGYDATQTAASNQPQIVSSGSVILDNGKPAILWNKTNNNNLRNLSVSTSASMTFSWVGSMTLPTSSFSYAFEIGTFDANNGYLFTPRIHNGVFDYVTGDLVNFGKGYTTSSAPRFISNGVQVVSDTQVLFNGILTSTIAKAYKNNSAITSRVAIAASVPITSSLKIGTNTFNEAYPGKMQELIFWGLNQDTNINGINTNTNDFYSIY